MRELWEEYEAGASPTAQLVKDFDKLEMIIQVWSVRPCVEYGVWGSV